MKKLNHIISLISLTSYILAQDIQNLSNNQIPDLVQTYGSPVVMIIADRDNPSERGQGSGVIVDNGNYVIT